jgi:succinyl-diaminopimelate desuccinylase
MPVISNSLASLEPISLTRKLLSFDTINPPGNELAAAEFLGKVLEDAGFKVARIVMGENRCNLIADLAGTSEELPLVLSGHIDTVPLGNSAWAHSPFSGEIENGRLYGRGSSDMKAGIAAIICAAVHFIHLRRPKRSLRFILTAGEETGCLGALHLKNLALLGPASGILIAEPTCNFPALGHKGALFMRCKTEGVTAHSSMPEQGINAIYKAARAITQLERFEFATDEHPLLGKPTLNVGTISGGLNVNSVPDRAEFTIDVRSVAGMNHAKVLQTIASRVGPDVVIEPFVDLNSVATSADSPFIHCVFSIMEDVLRAKISPRSLPFFTDACVFSQVSPCPIVILGPGEPEMAHKTDEYCLIARIEEATEAYRRIIENWCG